MLGGRIMTEILAPVGGKEQLFAAVRSGANAIYLGTKNFNARRNASNFSAEELKNVVSYCHARNVKVYVTMNTIITDNEIEEAINNISDIAKSGADAVIVQDLAVAYLIKKICPSLKLHASTQMTVTNIHGVNLLESMGFSRVVLARELSFKEIQSIVRQSNIEIEVFVHGSMCMSVSGCCYLSSALGDRSGNRGLCAQPCRLNFKCKGKPFALSLKDMSYIKHIKKLQNIGVHSLKIEGRMKRPEYVAMAVDSCKKALCGIEYDCELLKNVFSRSGFTDGYFTGKRNYEMFGVRSKDDVNASISTLKNISKLYEHEQKNIEINGTFTARKNSPSSFCVSDNFNNVVTVYGAVPEQAKNSGINKERVKSQLQKVGDAPFVFKNIDVNIDDNLFLPVSEINNLRRSAIDKMLQSKGQSVSHIINDFKYDIEKYKSSVPTLRLRFRTFEQSFNSDLAEYIILPLSEIIKHPQCFDIYAEKLVCELPSLCFEENSKLLYSQLNKLWSIGVKKVSCENICMIKILKDFNFSVIGGHGLNIQNTIALNEYSNLGLKDLTISFELYSKKISNLGNGVKRGVIGYGYLPLMKFRCCPASGQDCKNCSGAPIITDRIDKTFNVICSEHMYSCMLNSVPLYVGDKNIENVDFYTLYFTNEDKSQAENILNLFVNKKPINSDKTTGMYFRKLK